MRRSTSTRSVLSLATATLLVSALACDQPAAPSFQPIAGFTEPTNTALREFFQETRTEPGRKVAVFDGDGTVFGQVPHYLADECLYAEAMKNPTKKPDVIAKMTPWSNVSHPYVMHRVYFFEGDTVQSVRDLGDECFRKLYPNKIYRPMKDLVTQLDRHGFETWIVTASPEAMYQKFLSRELAIPITHVIGVKAVVHDGKITSRIVEPVPQDEGKRDAIETYVQERPLLVGGNSRGDKEMIEFSRRIKMIINPDEHIAEGQTESMADYAKRQGWLVERIRDVTEPGFPAVSTTQFKVKQNKAHE